MNENGNIIQVGNIFPDTETYKNRTAGRVYSAEGLAPTIRTPSGGGIIPQIVVYEERDNVMAIDKVEYEERGDNEVVEHRYRIRKLTPRECFRLMGVDDADIDKLLAANISNTQLYRCAGNSIVVDVLYHIMRKAFCEKGNENQQQTLF